MNLLLRYILYWKKDHYTRDICLHYRGWDRKKYSKYRSKRYYRDWGLRVLHIGYGCSDQTVERTWRRGHLHYTNRKNILLAWNISGIKPNAGKPQTYRISLPNVAGPRDFPVEGYKGRAVTRTGIHVHLLHRHIQDTVVILEEGSLTHPRCPCCDM